MTNPLPRIYVIAGSVLVLFLAWAVIAAHPWVPAAGAKADPRMQALAAREQRLRHDALVIKRIVNKRWHTYTVALRLRKFSGR